MENIKKEKMDETFKIIGSNFNDDMSDEEKYKIIFDWIVNNCDYDYVVLDMAKADSIVNSLRSKKLFMKRISILRTFEPELSIVEKLKRLLIVCDGDDDLKELSLYEKEELKFRESAEKMSNESSDRKNCLGKSSDVFISHLGVCADFSDMYKTICNNFDLECEQIYGNIFVDGFELSHAWNAIIIDDEIRNIDISGAIHSKDGSYSETMPNDFFNLTFKELKDIDGDKIRTINDKSAEVIINMEENIGSSKDNSHVKIK